MHETTGSLSKLEGREALLQVYGIRIIMRTGKIAISRNAKLRTAPVYLMPGNLVTRHQLAHSARWAYIIAGSEQRPRGKRAATPGRFPAATRWTDDGRTR